MLRTEIFKQYNNNEDLNRKEAEIRVALLMEPENLSYLKELGALVYYKKNCKSAKVIYKKLTELEPKNGDNFAFLGYIQYELEEYEEAIKNFNKAVSLVEDSSFVNFLLGNAYSRTGKIMNAIKCYDLAIFKNLDIYNVHVDFAKKCEDMGRFEKAYKEYKAAYEIDPRDKKIEQKINEMREKINNDCIL